MLRQAIALSASAPTVGVIATRLPGLGSESLCIYTPTTPNQTGIPTVGLVGFVLWMDRVQIRAEERALGAHFGAAYANYCARVRRWL